MILRMHQVCSCCDTGARARLPGISSIAGLEAVFYFADDDVIVLKNLFLCAAGV